MLLQAERTCAGGWCHMRDTCCRYQPGTGRAPSAERLCNPGSVLEWFVPLNRPPVMAPIYRSEART